MKERKSPANMLREGLNLRAITGLIERKGITIPSGLTWDNVGHKIPELTISPRPTGSINIDNHGVNYNAYLGHIHLGQVYLHDTNEN